MSQRGLASSHQAVRAISGDAEFSGGNGVEFERMAPDRLRFQMVKHASPSVLWWQFRAQVPTHRRVTFELVNTADTLSSPKGWTFVRPVYSYDRKKWQRLPAGDCHFDAARGRFVFSGVFTQPVVYLAQAYPYHQAELDVLRSALQKSPLFHAGFAGRTEQGRPYPLWTLSSGGGSARSRATRRADGSTAKLGVCLSARLHAGETHGSVALDAMLREIAFGRSAAMRWLRRKVDFLIAPMADYDGVSEGMFGKDRFPIDFNRDWSAQPVRPEIRRLQQEIAVWAGQVRFAVYLDFHCPCLPDVPHLFGAVPGMSTARLKAAEQQFAHTLARRSPRGAKFFLRDLLYPGYQGPTSEIVAARYMTNVYGVLALTPEIAYHPTRRSARDEAKTGPVVDLPSLRKLGAAHAHALADLLQKNEGAIRQQPRPFFDPGEPNLAPLSRSADSPFARWGLLGGDLMQFTERRLRGAELPPQRKPASVAAPVVLAVAARPDRPAFFVTAKCPVSPTRASATTVADGLSFMARIRGGVRGAGRSATSSAPGGLLIHVFYYDKTGARFGRLVGSELQEFPLGADWRTFAPQRPVPAGAVTARLAIRCEFVRGTVEILPVGATSK